MSFDSLGLAPVLLSSIKRAGFNEATPVQLAAIPATLEGADLMVSAQTGSGKTAAFMLPALHRIASMPSNKGRGVQVLVLAPTRELAMQVSEAAATYGSDIEGLRVATVVGGMPYGAQLKALSRRVDVLVATPGRLLDHLQARRVDLSTVHTLILDEADRMLDMGFIDDLNMIVDRTPQSRQTLLFSATLDGSVAGLAARMMREPRRIELVARADRHANITQSLLYADDAGHKLRLLDHLLRDSDMDQAIVFTATKRGADDLAVELSDRGFSAMALHGDMNQRQRTRTIEQVQGGRVKVLVATDVAARGIDVQAISHAINFDLPMQPEDYIHRIGRTGRAGRDGLAFTLAVHGERHKVRRIEHFIGRPIPPETIVGLEPQRTPRPRSEGAPRPGGNKPRPGARRPGGSNDRNFASREGRGFGAPRDTSYAPRAEKSFGDRTDRHASAPRTDNPYAPRHAAPEGRPFEHRAERPAERGFDRNQDRGFDRAARDDRRPAASAKPGPRGGRDFSATTAPARPFAARDNGPRPATTRPGAPRAASGARRGFNFDGGRR